MIGRDEIAEAVRYIDALSEEHEDIPQLFTDLDVDLKGLLEVAEQRALRAMMMLAGMDPNVSRLSVVRIPPAIRKLESTLMGMYLDAFGTALRARKQHNADGAR